MRKLVLFLATLLSLSFAAFAQEHYTEGPLWRVQLIRVKPNKMDAYLQSLRESTKPLLEEQKKQGSIMDYKVFLKETKANPEDWDIAVAVQYKNHAALDGLAAKGEAGPMTDPELSITLGWRKKWRPNAASRWWGTATS
jgi:hypothetical protein